jgi:hypothetical protein
MIPAIWEVEAEDHKFEANPGKVSKTLSQKKKKNTEVLRVWLKW